MATTKIWDIRGRLDKVLNYAWNPEKTTNPEFMKTNAADSQQGMDLQRVMAYATNEQKTEQQLFVTGINCNPEFACKQMQETKRHWGKEGGIVAYHAYQSFAAGEITPAQAHQIGIELAQKLWGDRFEVVVATHLNTGNLHNHFVVNSVSLMDGKRYYDNKATYRQMRETSDELCRQHGISVIENPQPNQAKAYAEWQAEKEGKPTVRGMIRDDLDAAIAASATPRQFWRTLEKKGYKLKLTGVKYPAICPPYHDRFFRLNKLGEDYTPEAIRNRIMRNAVRKLPMPEPPPRVKRCRLRGKPTSGKRITGLRALYFKYLYALGVLPRNRPNNRRVHAVLREDLIKLDSISAQTRLLWGHRIDTRAQLFLYHEQLSKKQKESTGNRRSLRSELRRAQRSEPEEAAKIESMKAQIAALSKELATVRRELALCDAISARSANMAQRLKIVETEKIEQHQKEVKQHEHVR